MSDALSIPDLLPSTSAADFDAPATGEQFLRLHLVPDTTVLLPVAQLTEVLMIPIGQIVPIPHMPAWVMGIYNWRGEVLWMVDLGHLCGLIPWYQQMTNISLHPTVVLQISLSEATSTSNQSQTLGLVVDRVEDIEWCEPGKIQALSSASVVSGLAPFLEGYWRKREGDMLAVLNGEAIIKAMPKS
jgi:positive phototaxis protein PixI